MLAQHADERRILVRVRLGGNDVVPQVRPVEAGDDGLGILEPELPHDIGADMLGRRRGERHDRRPAEPFAHLCDAQVARAEIVTPLADAMCLVDRQQRHTHLLETLGRAPEIEPLRCEVQHLHASARDARHALRYLAGREGAIDEGGRNTTRRQRVHLILHE